MTNSLRNSRTAHSKWSSAERGTLVEDPFAEVLEFHSKKRGVNLLEKDETKEKEKRRREGK